MANLHLENFAKIKNSNLDIQDITVIAGKPGTGKSYIMKMMYAINEAFYLNLKSYHKLINDVFEDKIIDDLFGENKKELLKSIQDSLQNEKLILDNLKKNINDNLKNLIISIFSNYSQISNNFIVSYDNLQIKLENEILNIKTTNAHFKKKIEEIVFVETPLILEFKKFMNREKGKTPYHIESLLKVLDTDYSFTDEEQDKFIADFTKKSHEIIQGNIESHGDSFIFNKTDDKNYDIVNASSGIKSIGLLQYLVTNKALKKGSVLFWEEPEVHLHPTWQLKMIELFIELMNAGVKVVFSTHSPYMCDYLNALSEKRDFKNRVSFNLLQEKDNIVENIILNDNNWKMLQSELLDPLEEIMWEYL